MCSKRMVRWVDVLEIRQAAELGRASPEDVVRLTDEVLRCWDHLYAQAERPRRETAQDVARRFAPRREAAAPSSASGRFWFLLRQLTWRRMARSSA